MTPRWFSVPFLLFFGGAILAIAYQGYKAGKLPFGHTILNGLYYITREDSPANFCMALLLYVACGLFLFVYGLLQLVGAAPAMHWQ